MEFVVRNGLVALDSTIGKLAMSAWQNEPVDPVWIDCYYAMWLDNIVAAVLIAGAAYVTTKITVLLVQTAIQVGILLWYTYTALGYMSLTVEQTVVIE